MQMGQIYIEAPRKLMQNKKRIESALNAKISVSSNIANVEANPEDELIAIDVLEAMNLGFKISDTLLLKEEDFILKKISIKGIARKGRSNLQNIRGRILGKKGTAIKTISNLTGCSICLRGNIIGIIGKSEDAENAEKAMKKLIRGSVHGKVYGYLEKLKAEENQSF